MNGSALKHIEKLEADLWEAADNLWANWKLTSSDCFMPVLGIISWATRSTTSDIRRIL
jgi:type I restriction enzyme M protein